MKTTLTMFAVLAALTGPAAAGAVPEGIARSAGADRQGGLLTMIAGKNNIAKQCERNADYHKLTGLAREAHIENCLKTMSTFSDKKKGVGQQ